MQGLLCLPKWSIWTVTYEKTPSLQLDNIRLLKVQKFSITKHSDFSLKMHKNYLTLQHM